MSHGRWVHVLVLGSQLGAAAGATMRGWYWEAFAALVVAFFAAWALDRANARVWNAQDRNGK